MERHYSNLDGIIIPAKAELLVSRVSQWIEGLEFDTRWFTRAGLATSLSMLTDSNPTSLKMFEIILGNDAFQSSNVQKTLTTFLQRQSPSLENIRVRQADSW